MRKRRPRRPWPQESERGYAESAISSAAPTMHLLKSGVDITTIAAWLGHADLSTTHGYVEIDLRMKQAAVAASATLPDLHCGAFPTGDLLTWLASLGRPDYAQRPPPQPPN